MDNTDRDYRERHVYEASLPAGKRKYFMDIRSTRQGDYFLTLTEKRKRGQGAHVERNTLHIYKEDLAKFSDMFKECVAKMQELVTGLDKRPRKGD